MNKLEIVANEPQYWEQIRMLRIDPSCKDGFVKEAHITYEQQIKYMQRRGNDFNVCLKNKEFVGYMRVIDNDIAIAVLPEFRNQGIGLFMINELMKMKPESYAKIKIDNKASIKLFESAGFKLKYLHYEKVNK